MKESFRIYVDRLRKGGTQKILDTLRPNFLGEEEAELKFPSPVEVKGEAYLSEEHLVIHLGAKTSVLVPCSICNEWTELTLEVKELYQAISLNEIKGAIFDFAELLREALLIELPAFAECSQAKCPKREAITPYIKAEKKTQDDTYFPFLNL